MLKGCYPSLHRSRLPPIFFLPFLLLCPVRWFKHTFKKFVKLDKRWECKRKRSKYFFINLNERKKNIYSFVQWSSQFHHDEMHITLCCGDYYLQRVISYLYIYEYFIWYRTLVQYEQDNLSVELSIYVKVRIRKKRIRWYCWE